MTLNTMVNDGYTEAHLIFATHYCPITVGLFETAILCDPIVSDAFHIYLGRASDQHFITPTNACGSKHQACTSAPA